MPSGEEAMVWHEVVLHPEAQVPQGYVAGEAPPIGGFSAGLVVDDTASARFRPCASKLQLLSRPLRIFASTPRSPTTSPTMP